MAPAVDLAGGGWAGARAGDHHGAAGRDEEERVQHRLQPRRWAGEEGDYQDQEKSDAMDDKTILKSLLPAPNISVLSHYILEY